VRTRLVSTSFRAPFPWQWLYGIGEIRPVPGNRARSRAAQESRVCERADLVGGIFSSRVRQEGCCIYLVLPDAPSRVRTVTIKGRADQCSAEGHLHAPHATNQVLVVDDHPLFRRGILWSDLENEQDIVVVGEAVDNHEALQNRTTNSGCCAA